MIEFQDVSKTYGATQALKNLKLSIPEGQIVGLIGHNGAGKSTTIKSLVSVINPTSGKILVDGLDLASHRLRIKQKIGYVADSPDLFLRLTAQEFWDLVAASYGMTSKEYEGRLVDLLKLFDFTSHRYEVIETFSHGMRQKVFVIGALLSDPYIWVLDEPDKGKTVLFSTHLLEVAEQICDRLAILKKGELIFYGTVAELKAEHPDQSLEAIYLNLAGRKEEGESHAS